MFDDRLKELRIRKGLNMKQAATLLDISYTTYVGYEKNEREPNSEILILLADFFDCSVDYLIGRSEKPSVNYSDDVPGFRLSPREKQIILAYRQNPSMQSAVDRLLGVEAAAEEQKRA